MSWRSSSGRFSSWHVEISAYSRGSGGSSSSSSKETYRAASGARRGEFALSECGHDAQVERRILRPLEARV